MAAPLLKLPPSSFFFFFFLVFFSILWNAVEAANWCVARSDASNEALQTALDYACSAGADCTPILSDGLCFLPNTIQAHASYAFNSYFQRRSMAPGSCDFAGTANIAKTDPSYGSCDYPSSLSTAGGLPSTTTTTSSTPTSTNNPNVPTTPGTVTPLDGDAGNGFNPGMSPPIPTSDNSEASSVFLGKTSFIPLFILLVLSFSF